MPIRRQHGHGPLLLPLTHSLLPREIRPLPNRSAQHSRSSQYHQLRRHRERERPLGQRAIHVPGPLVRERGDESLHRVGRDEVRHKISREPDGEAAECLHGYFGGAESEAEDTVQKEGVRTMRKELVG